MSRLRIPCRREVHASLDEPNAETDACVVACPPHPQMGGSRTDPRLEAVADALVARDVACLRFDYGEWDGGRGERRDADCALDWAADEYDRVGLFGYSFGGAVALVAAADRDDLGVVAVLAPGAGLPDGSDATESINGIRSPVLVVYGERDETVESGAVVDRARDAGHAVEAVPADHHFVGQRDRVGGVVADFLAGHLP